MEPEHPLTWLFRVRNLSVIEGMNWLEECRLISDLCVTPEDVAPCDIRAVLDHAGFSTSFPEYH